MSVSLGRSSKGTGEGLRGIMSSAWRASATQVSKYRMETSAYMLTSRSILEVEGCVWVVIAVKMLTDEGIDSVTFRRFIEATHGSIQVPNHISKRCSDLV